MGPVAQGPRATVTLQSFVENAVAYSKHRLSCAFTTLSQPSTPSLAPGWQHFEQQPLRVMRVTMAR